MLLPSLTLGSVLSRRIFWVMAIQENPRDLEYTVATSGPDDCRLFDQAQIKRICLVGSSYGRRHRCDISLDRPDLVERLVPSGRSQHSANALSANALVRVADHR